MTPGSRPLIFVLVAVIAGVGLLIGSPAVAAPVLAFVATAALLARRHDQPMSAELRGWSARWYLFLATGAAFLLVGFGALLTDGDGDLTTPAWAIWVLSWLVGAIVGIIGLGLGATRLVGRRRT